MADEYIRKIDAFDAVEARITELMTHPEFRRKHLDIDLSGIIRNISAIKPADVAPVIHGKWTRILLRNEKGGCIGAEMICSKCGSPNGHDEKTRFCPHCGAKMDEGKE